MSAPVRAQHAWRQHLRASPARVFPLLCPVRERDWARGWNPRLVVSRSGVVERDCVFVTPGHEGTESIWYVTQHDPARHFVEMIYVTPRVTACRLRIQLRPEGQQHCSADIEYMHTSLGPAGDAFVARFTADYYRQFMLDWERELNEYLQSGRPLG